MSSSRLCSSCSSRVLTPRLLVFTSSPSGWESPGLCDSSGGVRVCVSLWARIALGSPCFWCSCSLPCAFVCCFVSVGKVCACLSVVLVLIFTAVCDLYGWTIAATVSVVISCSSSADMCCGSVCVAMSCGGGFTADGTYDSVWDSVKPVTGNSSYFQFQEVVGCVCMLSGWFSSNDEVCADIYIYFRFKLKDMCRSVKWELYLYGDMSIKVDRDSVEVLPRGCATASVLHPWQRVTLLL